MLARAQARRRQRLPLLVSVSTDLGRSQLLQRRALAAAAAQQQLAQQQLALAKEAREDALWLSKPTHSQLLQPPPHARLGA